MSELTKEHFDKQLGNLATKDYLLKFTNEIIFPRVGEIVEEKVKVFKDEILTGQDKIIKKLDLILKEQAAHTKSYQRLEKRINYLEAVVKVMAEREGIEFHLDPDI